MLDPVTLARESLKRRKAAPYHFQVELDRQAVRQSIDEIAAPLTRYFYHSVNIPIHGRVVRFFGLRRRSWREGAALFSIPMLSPQGGFLGGPTGIQQKDLLRITHLEVYLNRTSSDYVPTKINGHSIGIPTNFIAYEFTILENGPTAKPVMTVKELQERLTRWEKKNGLPPNKWWEFWKERPSARRYPRIKPATILGLDLPPRRPSARLGAHRHARCLHRAQGIVDPPKAVKCQRSKHHPPNHSQQKR